jgi:ATP-dependent 26S proteasome regulatory subunit
VTDVADRVDGLGGLLGRLDRILGRATERMVQALGPQASGDPFRGLYISDHDALRLSTSPRSSPILGVAEGEVSLAEVLEPGSRLATLARDHGLSGFDLEVVGLALAPEIELVYERLYAFLQDDVSRRRPSVDLALNLLCPSAEAKVARREHFASDAPLIRHELVALQAEPASPSPPLLARFIKLDDAVVRFLLGEGGLDPRVRHDCALLEPGAVQAAGPTVDARVGGLAPLVATAHATCRPLRLYFSGPPDGAKRQAAALLAAAAGARLLVVDVDGALEATDAPAVTARLLCREARLHDAILYLEPAGALASAEAGGRRLMEALADHAGVAIIAGAANEPPRGRGVAGIVSVPFPIPEHDERRACWERSTSAQGIALAPDDIDRLAGRFRLTPDQISDAVQSGAYVAYGRGEQPSAGDLFAAARSRSDTDLAGVARKIEPTHDWGQIALPEDTLRQLRELCQQVVKRHQVLDRWGFARRLSLGKGVNALFAGPSGTGKTMAADIIARELGLDLYKVDLSGVVSKYIGETEKNLARIFSAAENANAILLFDEADALFGKRSEVRDSHDRYANIEIAYLLQQMEQYEGVAILATNLRQNMDEAFVRRLQFVVEFPFPDAEQRARIWELQFPDEADRDPGIDYDLLAGQFRVTGGSIKNIVLSAAFLAATERAPIGTGHLIHATRREYDKLGKVLTDAELAPYGELVAL